MSTAELWNELMVKELEPFFGMAFDARTAARLNNTVLEFRLKFFHENRVHYGPLPIFRADGTFMLPAHLLFEHSTDPLLDGNAFILPTELTA